MFTLVFWKAAAERAAKTAGQSGLLAIAADQVNALHLDWVNLGGFMLGGAVLSVLTSVASSALTSEPGPSLTNAETLPSEVVAKVEPAVPSGAVAGEGSEFPTGTPVDVEPVEYDGFGAPISDRDRL